jgi:hypothetical protein
MPHLCEFYPGICLTTEEKHRKTLVRVRKTVGILTLKLVVAIFFLLCEAVVIIITAYS